MRGTLLLLASVVLPLSGQTPCATEPIYTPCELVFELNAAELGQHPNPYETVTLQAEFRSPRFRTFLMPGYFDGGNRMVIRFAAVDPGQWDYRVTSNIASFDGKIGKFEATPSDNPGFIMPRNVHHWSYVENNVPHLWMGDTNYRFATMDRAAFESITNARAAQKFNHVRGFLIGAGEDWKKAWKGDSPDPAYFTEVDSRVRFLNVKGIIADLVIAASGKDLAAKLTGWQQRERFVRYITARYSAYNITWQGVDAFENFDGNRELLKAVGDLLKKYDPFRHPRSTNVMVTSSPLLADEWMDHITYQTGDSNICAIEHQLYPVPFVNAGFATEGSDADAFRKRLWNATMDGQYPTLVTTGGPDTPGARAMKAWYEFFADTRHWELEPYFDVDGGRAIALPDVEYIIYMEKPGPVEVLVERHGYDINWFNPATGETTEQKKWKGEKFTGEPPTRSGDWVLHISREGRKDSMHSYKFESRQILMQEMETQASRVPFEIAAPAGDTIKLSVPTKYEAKIKRPTHATRLMMYLWTAEVPGDAKGFRVIGTGAAGSFTLTPESMGGKTDSVITVRLAGMNAVGKLYVLDKVYQVGQ
jgi:hypothetical protein